MSNLKENGPKVEERRTDFRVGEWTVQVELNSLARDGVVRHIEPKVMKVLLTLSAQQGRVVSKEELISTVWPDTFVGDDVLTRCISILRRITDDDPHTPHFIQTIPKVGYRLVAPVSALAVEVQDGVPTVQSSSTTTTEPAPVHSTHTSSHHQGLRIIGWTVATGLTFVSLFAMWSYQKSKTRLTRASVSFRTIQFTSYAGEQIQPAFSPDGKRIAFVWISEDTASRRIYVKTIGTEEVKQLTSDTDEQFSPTWSPDGRQIAYLARSNEGLSLSVASAKSQELPRKLLIPQQPSHWEQGALSWAPSGKSLIYPDHSGTSPDSSVFLLDLQTFNTKSITTPPPGWEGDLNPAYSPDGRWIAFTRASETAVRDIFFMSAATGELHELTHDHMNIDSLTWTADSSCIIFSSNRGGKYGLWKIGLRDKTPERLPVGTEDAYQPTVGPRPGQLAYTQGSAIWSILRLQSSGKESSIQPDAVLTSTQQDSAPSLSPDGSFFAFQSRRSGNQEIWIASQAGDQLRQLTFMAGPLTGSPSWSNHGNKILFDSRPGGHSHIFCVAAAGGRPKQLTFGDANDITPRWSHDDQSIYFRSNRGYRWQLWRVSAAGGDPQPVTTGDGIVPQESPDGKWLYYTRGSEDGIWRVPPSGGAETQILAQPSADYWGYWQVTPRGIFYLDRSASSTAIRIFNPDTKVTSLYTTLKEVPPVYSGLAVARGGKVVLLTDQHDAGRHITLIQTLGQ